MVTLQALVVSGTRGAGKSTLAVELVSQGGFVVVKAVTTRSPRHDDQAGVYEYLDHATIDKSLRDGDLAVSASYGEHLYGVRRSDIDAAAAGGATPLMTLTPQSAHHYLAGEVRGEVVGVFLDANDWVLDRRLVDRDGGLQPGLFQQRSMDRSYDRAPLQHVDSDCSMNDLVARVRSLLRGASRASE